MGRGWIAVKARSVYKPTRPNPTTSTLKDVGVLVFRKVTPHEATGT